MKVGDIYSYEIPGNPITKKNSQRIVRMGQRYAIRPSKQYEAYEKSSVAYLKNMDKLPKEPIDYPVMIQCTYYMKDRRKVDMTNLLEATDDILVKAGILADDNRNIVASHDFSRVWWDKERPGVVITIRDLPESYDQWSAEKVAPRKKPIDFPM